MNGDLFAEVLTPRRPSLHGSIFAHARANVTLGDAREGLRAIPSNSLDAVVTDAPYELGFMGKSWDSSGIAFDRTFWAEVQRVMKPGAHLACFGGTRTFHRIAVAIEDGGLEIRDTLAWMYGTGFPKSNDLGEGRGTALKPAFEPIILSRKPPIGTVETNLDAWGTGALNIDACRLPGVDTRAPRNGSTPGFNHKVGVVCGSELGRWPANVILDEEAGALLDLQAPNTGAAARATGPTRSGRSDARARGTMKGTGDELAPFHGDRGGASRFFYSAKTSRAERDLGCEHLEPKSGGEATEREEGSAALSSPRSGAGRGGGARNHHPTVKPVSLMRWIVRLVTPPGGLVLDPFTGSASTGVAAWLEDRDFLGFELTAEYAPIIAGRMQAAVDGRFAEFFARRT